MLTIKEGERVTKQSFYNDIIQPIEEKMIRTVWRITRNFDDANDAFQQSIEVILKHMSRVIQHPNPQALVLKICMDEAYSVLRRKHPNRLCFVESYNPNRFSHDLGIDQTLIDQETEEEILQAIGELPPSQSTAVFMRFVLNEPYTHIANALDCDEATARKHVSIARSKLAGALHHLLSDNHKVQS